MSKESIDSLQQRFRQFAKEREWEQFHTPKNIAIALSVEAAELLEHFQWLTGKQSEALDEGTKRQVSYEMADVFLYLIRLADLLDIDLLNVSKEKMQLNGDKYPAEKVRGSSKKYTEYK